MTSNCKQIIDFLGCEYILFENETDLQKITDKYSELREKGKKEGFTPLMIAVSDNLAEMAEFFCEELDELTPEAIAKRREETVKKSLEIKVNDFFLRAKDELAEIFDDEDYDNAGEFEGEGGINTFSGFCSYDGKLEKEILIANIPTDKPWELPIYVPMGGFNSCPSPEEQAAVFKYWYEKYGAYPACVTYDIWEMFCERPVKDEKSALELANEMYLFCNDIVDQGTETIGRLAGSLVNSSVWFFWWD